MKKMSTIPLIIASVLLNALAQLLIKKGMMAVGPLNMVELSQNIIPMLTNVWLWCAMISYAVSILLWMSVLSKVEVSFAYPFLSIGYIVSAIAGYALFNENLSPARIIGIVIICIGVIFISRS